MSDNPLHLLCIGHCCHDKVMDNFILGGTASYCSLFAQKQGVQTSILTSVGDDFKFFETFIFNDIKVHNQVADGTTVFENKYDGDHRTQYMNYRANDIKLDLDVKELLDADIVLVGTIADEVELSKVSNFSKAFIAGAVQGSMRQWNDEGLIAPAELEYSDLKGFDLLILSEDDISGIENAIERILEYVDHLVITKGQNGAVVYVNDSEYFFPSFDTQETDATGAGDIFTIAYVLEYFRTKGDFEKACTYAHCAASIVIESQGTKNIPSERRIRGRMKNYRLTR